MAQPDLLNLFNANPPSDDARLVELFCNRERELQYALRILASRTVSNEILAVYGETRSGKSHFMRVVVRQLPAKEGSWRIFTLNANNRGDARAVLDDAFLHLWRVLQEVRGKVIDPPARREFDAFLEDQDRRRRLLVGEYAERSDEVSDGVTDTIDGALEFKAGGLTAKVGDRREARHGELARTTARAPSSDREVVEWIRDQLDALRDHEPARPVLLFVDDLDLLHRRGRPGSEASAELVDRLKALAEHPQVQVVVTLRTAYFNGREKDLHNFVRLPLLEDDVTREIYHRHIARLHGGADVLTSEALTLLVEGANGQVGMFLKTCRDLYQWGYRSRPMDVADVAAFVDHELRQLRRMPECVAYMPLIEQALRDKQLSVEIADDLQDTPLLHNVLLEVPGQPHRFLINGIWSQGFLRSTPRGT